MEGFIFDVILKEMSSRKNGVTERSPKLDRIDFFIQKSPI